MSINITELDASLTLRNLNKEEKQAVVRLMELAIEETKAAMQARIEKLEKATFDLFQACSNLCLPCMDKLEKEINAVSEALK